MLNQPVSRFERDDDGKVCGVTSIFKNEKGEEVSETVKTKMVICSPTYMLETGEKDKVKSIGKIIRCICILDHCIPNTKDASAC